MRAVGAKYVGEMLLRLRRDTEARVKLVRDHIYNCWEVIGNITMKIYVEK